MRGAGPPGRTGPAPPPLAPRGNNPFTPRAAGAGRSELREPAPAGRTGPAIRPVALRGNNLCTPRAAAPTRRLRQDGAGTIKVVPRGGQSVEARGQQGACSLDYAPMRDLLA